MTLSKSNIRVYVENLDLYNFFQESFNSLKIHSNNINVHFIHSEFFDYQSESVSNKLDKIVVISSKSAEFLSFHEMQKSKIAVFANHLEYSNIHQGINNLGFQRQICNIDSIKKAESSSEFNFSLGLLAASNEIVSLELRSIEYTIVDLSILPKYPLNLANNSLLIGIQLENLIQLISYCTNSHSFTGFFFNTSNLDFNKLDILSELFSTILWYIVEGVISGPITVDYNTHCDKILSTLKNIDQDLEFIHQNGNYWVKLAYNEEDPVPCTTSEYEEGVLGNISSRLFIKLFNNSVDYQ